MKRQQTATAARQRGVALAFGLIILLVITVIGIGAMRSSIFELHMARNEEARVTALERAQSIVDATITVASNLLVAGSVSDTNCKGAYYANDNCTSSSVTFDNSLDDATINARASVRCRGNLRRARHARGARECCAGCHGAGSDRSAGNPQLRAQRYP